ncbi:TPA: hypothetical protein ACH3X1_000128 [Trebouxia sp. C0004]
MKQSKISEMPSEFLTAALSCAYKDLMQSRIGPRIPTRSNTCHSKPQGTISNAFLKSTKQQYSFPDAFPCRVCLCLSIKDFNDVVCHAEIFPETCLSFSFDAFIFTPRLQFYDLA